eukprot:959787_1
MSAVYSHEFLNRKTATMDVKLVLKGDAPEDLIDGNHLKQGDCMINNILEYLGQAAGDMAEADTDEDHTKALNEFAGWVKSILGAPKCIDDNLEIKNVANVTFTECSPGVYEADVHLAGKSGALTPWIAKG